METVVILELTVQIESFEHDVRKLISLIRPEWIDTTRSVLQIETVDCGHMNRNVTVSVASNPQDRVFVRTSNPQMKFYLRNHVRNYKFFHEQELSAKMHCIFTNGACMEYLDGTPITWTTTFRLFEPLVQRAVAVEVARHHTQRILVQARQIGFQDGIGWHEPDWMRALFQGLENHYVCDDGRTLALPTASDILRELDFLTEALDRRESPIVFVHGDVNPTNIVYNDQTQKATFVDYDSPSVTHAVFEIAVHFIAMTEPFNVNRKYPDIEYQREWIRTYLEHKNKFDGRFEEVDDNDIGVVFEDLKIGDLKAILHLMSCFAGMTTILDNPRKPTDKEVMLQCLADHWTLYHKKKAIVFA